MADTYKSISKVTFVVLGVTLFMVALFETMRAAPQQGFTQQPVASGLTAPTAMAFAPDGRLFVLQQAGVVRVIQNDVLLPTPFLSISANVNSMGERGLLGIAFDPNFASNQFLYLHYTTAAAPYPSRVSRFTANGNVVVPGSEVTILDLDPHGATNHIGGGLHFGADGKLYIATGDNAVRENSQMLSNLHGKILRVNPDPNNLIPTDNPFYNSTSGKNRAIWALGLRNPFTFAVQPVTGRIFINDVGQGDYEEVNEGVAGANYGWPICDGQNCQSSVPNHHPPAYAYLAYASPGGCSVVGGVFYNPPVVQFPQSYVGRYFFTDYCAGWIHTVVPGQGPSVASVQFSTGLSNAVDLKVGPDGSLYTLSHGGGTVTKFVYASSDTTPPTVALTAPAAGATLTGTVTISGTASDDTGVVGVQFRLDGSPIGLEDTSAPYSISWDSTGAANGSHTVTAVARDAAGNATVSSARTVTTSNTDTVAPTVSLTAPAAGATVSGSVTVSASASDNVGVAGVQFLLDGANLGAEDPSTPFSASWNTAASTNGTHTLSARVRDAAGNTALAASRTVTVSNGVSDTTPPATPTGLTATTVSISQINLSWTASSDNVGVTGYRIFRDGTSVGTSTTTAFSSMGLTASTSYTYTVQAYDAAGNNSAQSASASATTYPMPPPGLPQGFSEQPIASGLSAPTAMAFAPDGRLFVLLQGGTVRVIQNDVLLPTPFLSLSVASTGERGLLGIAFDPNFASNQFLYLYYTTSTTPYHNRVSRFTANGNVVAAGSELPIIDLDNVNATNHNGGAIHFGADGKLYIATGQNGVGANSQTLSTLHGKLLRVNPDPNNLIPTDNPFYSTASGNNRAIWALGLRNPFTFAVQPATGRLFINDVGQSEYEEVNEGVAGANYGWPNCDGPNCTASVPNHRAPVFAYLGYGSPGGCSVIGGAFYNPPVVQFPQSYVGKYFFMDYCAGWIHYVTPGDGPSVPSVQFTTGLSSPVDLQVGPDGSLYTLARGGGGTVSKFVYASSDTTPPTTPTGLTATAVSTSQINLSWAASSDNVGVTGYRIFRGGTNVGTSATTTFSNTGLAASTSYTYTVQAYDAAGNNSGQSSSASATTQPPPGGGANLVSAFAFNEGSGTTAADASATQNNASLTSASWAAGQVGGALSVGGGGYANAPDSDALTPGVNATFEAWIYLNGTPSDHASIFNKWSQTADDEYLLAISPSRTVEFAWQTTAGSNFGTPAFNLASSSGQVPVTTWTHVAVVRTGTVLTFYINGTLSGSVTAMDNNPFRNGVNSLRIGAQSRGASRFFNGRIDEARIYTRALTQSEIQADMTTPIGGSGGGAGAGDTTAPTVSVSSPLNNAVVNGTVNVTATAADNVGVAGVQFQVDGVNQGAEDTSSPYAFSWNTAASGNGSHTLRAVARDAAGNTTNSSLVSVTVQNGDTTAPTVSVTSPTGGSSVSGTVSVNATAGDNIGVTSVQFQLDGVDVGAADTTAPYSYSWNTTTTTNGTHAVRAIARDAAGNQTTSAAVSVTVSNAAPPGGGAEAVSWGNLTNATATNGTITKSGGCDGCMDSAGLSVQRLDGGDAYIEFVANIQSQVRYLGLGGGNTGSAPTELRYAFRLAGNTLQVREYDVLRASSTIVAGDVLRIAIVGNQLHYLKNGTLIYTATVAPGYPMKVDVALLGAGAQFQNVVMSFVHW